MNPPLPCHPSVRVAALLAALALIPAAGAVPITFNFTGEVAYTAGPSVGLSVGDVIAGSFTFESATPDTSPSVTLGIYTGAMLSATSPVPAAIGTLDVANEIQVFNDFPVGSAYMDTIAYLISFLTVPGQLSLNIFSLAGGISGSPAPTVVTSDALPVTPSAISPLLIPNFTYFFDTPSGADARVGGPVRSVTLADPVSVADATSTARLAIPALLIVTLLRRRISRHAAPAGLNASPSS